LASSRGEAVPYAVQQPPAAVDAHQPGKSLPLFALRDDTPDALNAMRVTIASHGSAVSVQTPGSDSASSGAMSYVLDGQSRDVPVAAIQVHWPADAADFAGKIRVAAGDTLGLWHTVVDAAPVANLHSDGAQLIEDRVGIPVTQAKFWRLSWVGKPPSFALVSAAAEPATNRDTAEQSELVVAGTPVKDRPGEFQFDLGARPPVDRLSLELPELNTVINAEFLSRADSSSPWHRVAAGGLYRLQSADGELRNAPVVVGITPDRLWLVRVPPARNALGNGIPRLQVQWRAPEVVFLARGNGPFTLAYGSASAIGTAASLAALPMTVATVRATLATPRLLEGESRLKVSSAFPWKTSVLWAVLAAAVALLAAMAVRLSRELKNSAT
jgi:hypothetical protein